MNRWGIYEKAVPPAGEWPAVLQSVADAGYDFFEIAIDETPQRLDRLRWTAAERDQLRHAMRSVGVPIGSMVLSAHRSHPLGSAQSSERDRADQILRQAIDLAADLEIPLVQIAGYYVYDLPSTAASRDWFIEGLRAGCAHARERGIELAIENVDGEDILDIHQALDVVAAIGAPNLTLYPDVGNLAANGRDVVAELHAGAGHIASVHLKDTRIGVFRRVPFGTGIVSFRSVFDVLARDGYSGPLVVEMWNDGAAPDAAESAREWLLQQYRGAVSGRSQRGARQP